MMKYDLFFSENQSSDPDLKVIAFSCIISIYVKCKYGDFLNNFFYVQNRLVFYVMFPHEYIDLP